MTVQELQQFLDAFPPDKDVYLVDWNEEYAPPMLLTPDRIIIDEDGDVLFGGKP